MTDTEIDDRARALEIKVNELIAERCFGHSNMEWNYIAQRIADELVGTEWEAVWLIPLDWYPTIRIDAYLGDKPEDPIPAPQESASD